MSQSSTSPTKTFERNSSFVKAIDIPTIPEEEYAENDPSEKENALDKLSSSNPIDAPDYSGLTPKEQLIKARMSTVSEVNEPKDFNFVNNRKEHESEGPLRFSRQQSRNRNTVDVNMMSMRTLNSKNFKILNTILMNF